MKKIAFLTIILAAIAALGFGADEGKQVTLTGHVIDTTCYMAHGGKGSDHLKCAVMCAKKGIPLAILDEEANQIYLPISTDHSNPNTKLMDYVESKVKVTGKLFEKSGMKGIAIEKIERAG